MQMWHPEKHLDFFDSSDLVYSKEVDEIGLTLTDDSSLDGEFIIPDGDGENPFDEPVIGIDDGELSQWNCLSPQIMSKKRPGEEFSLLETHAHNNSPSLMLVRPPAQSPQKTVDVSQSSIPFDEAKHPCEPVAMRDVHYCKSETCQVCRYPKNPVFVKAEGCGLVRELAGTKWWEDSDATWIDGITEKINGWLQLVTCAEGAAKF